MRPAAAIAIAVLTGCVRPGADASALDCEPAAEPVRAATIAIGLVFASSNDDRLPVNTAQVVDALDKANGYLGSVDLQFDLALVEDHPRSPYATARVGEPLSTLDEVPLTLWVVEDVEGASARTYGDDAVAIEWDEFTNNEASNELAHELLHVIGRVQHTFEGFDELVDGSNCDSAGDGFCDTPADPGLVEENPQGCVWTADCEAICGVDANGDVYAPQANPHSYAPGQCVTPITSEQSDALAQGLGNWLACH